MKENAAHISDSYFKLLKDLNTETKLALISRLSKSVKKPVSRKNDSLKTLFGALKIKTSADKLIKQIKKSRTFTRKIEAL
ncbi:MAG: hypothetical protein HYR66_19195 [Sphingobacteriales bacterium]|nr:hypothetical protein [Sphingobacteriales bacterium]MBI3717189.1 hypothetical protein [Sphingobacteriales bacterium]